MLASWHKTTTILWFLDGFVQFLQNIFVFFKNVQFLLKNAFYNEKHIRISKLFSKKYSKIGLVGISNIFGLLIIVYY
jgi:hypothetical protein